MEELNAVHRYAAGALFSLALSQTQIHRQSVIPEIVAPDGDDGPIYQTLSEAGSIPWSSERCGLLRHILRHLNVDEQAWSGIEVTATLPDAKHHIGPLIKILHDDNGDDRSLSSTSSSTSTSKRESAKGEKSVAALSKAVDAMALSLEEFATVGGVVTNARTTTTTISNEQPSTSSNSNSSSASMRRWASMKKPLVDRQASDLQSEKESAKKMEEDGQDKEAIRRQSLVKQRKVAVLFEVLAACVADSPEEKTGKLVLNAGYDARQRAAVRLLALWLDIEWGKVAAIELMVAYMAMATEKEKQAEKAAHGGDETENRSWAKWKRGGIISAAAITGGALLAVTGGLAAPAIAAGLTAIAPAVVGAGGIAAAMGTAAGSAAVAASFGAAGAGLAGTKMARRTGGVDEFLFIPIGDNHQQGRLAVGIMISGVVFDDDDYTNPWEGPDWDLERYALRFESKELIAVSSAIEDWLASNAARELFKAGAMMTVLAGLVAALAWPATLLAATDWIDGKWAVAVDRSDKAGVILAKCLLRGTQGHRPVTLVGFSLGARVIFSCLEYLAKKGDAGSIVERVILLGAPITLDQERWKAVRKVVAGRFINAYSTNDWILGVIYRTSFLTQGLAGLQNVEIPGVENINVTEVVSGHSKYLTKTREILQALDIDSFYPIYPSTLHPIAAIEGA